MAETPTGADVLLFVIIAVAYLIWPADLIPDIIPIVGLIDDLAVGGMLAKGMLGSG